MKSSSLKPRRLILTSMLFSVTVAVLLSAGYVASSKSKDQETPPRDSKVSEMAQKNGTQVLALGLNNSPNPTALAAPFAATITVDRADDPSPAANGCLDGVGNDCSLRGAVGFANSNPGTTINIPPGIYTLSISGSENFNAAGDLDVLASTVIQGTGATPDKTIITTTPAFGDRVFDLGPGLTPGLNFTVKNLTIKDVTMSSSGGGGGIRCGAPTNVITLNRVNFENIHLTAASSANGAAVLQIVGAGSAGDLTIDECTFKNNVTDTGSGGAYRMMNNGTGTVTIKNSTFDSNSAKVNDGGAIDLAAINGGPYSILNSTFINNVSNSTHTGAISKSNAGNLDVHYSRFFGNSANSSGSNSAPRAVLIAGPGNADLTNNWWGCNGEPLTPATGCDNVVKTDPTATVTTAPRLELRHTASPNPISLGGSTTLTASFKLNSSSQDVSAFVGSLGGAPITFSNAVNGSLSPAQLNIQSSSTATATFTASQAGAGSADAKVDNATVKANVTINKLNTTTTITSHTPDPSNPGQSVTVNFSVSQATATGNVQVMSSDGVNCTGTLASGSGSCSLTFATAGTKTLTATYAGDSNYNSSSSATVSHQVNSPIQLVINDSSVVRPSSGSASMLFTVTLSQPAPSAVSVSYQTVNGSGTSPADYVAANGTVTFSTGDQFKVIAITIPANPSASGDKTFQVNLSSATQGTIVDGNATGTIKATRPQSKALITEVRTSGPNGPDDDFVEVYNNTDSPINVASTDSSAGWALVKMGASCSDTPVIIGTIPNGTIIPGKGHYLFTGTSYSLTGYALGDSTLSTNIDSDANLALFTVADLANLSTDNKLDGVGFGANTGGICDLLRNGNTLPVTQGSTAEYSFVRKDLGTVIDTGDNQADFTLVAVSQAATIGNGTTPALGAPGPQNLQSPVTRNGFLTPGLISPALSPNVAPNRVRVQGQYNYTDPITSQPISFPFGTIAIRRSYTNNTGQNMTALRFRIVIITAGGPAPAGTSDVRAISSLPEIVNVNGSDITVQGTTLQQPPNQPEGGGLNSTPGCCRLTGGTVAGERTVSLSQPLLPNQTISLQWLLGVKQTGNFQFYVNIEGLP